MNLWTSVLVPLLSSLVGVLGGFYAVSWQHHLQSRGERRARLRSFVAELEAVRGMIAHWENWVAPDPKWEKGGPSATPLRSVHNPAIDLGDIPPQVRRLLHSTDRKLQLVREASGRGLTRWMAAGSEDPAPMIHHARFAELRRLAEYAVAECRQAQRAIEVELAIEDRWFGARWWIRRRERQRIARGGYDV